MKGRTWRKRQENKKKSHSFQIDRSVIEENKQLGMWVKEKGMRKHHLQSRNFTATGRGMMALTNFNPGDVVISLPRGLLITADTVLDSEIGLFIKKSQPKLSLQQALALFLLLENKKQAESDWWNYIQTIPKSFTTCGYFSQDEILLLPDRLQNPVKAHIIKLRKAFRQCEHFCKIHSLCDKIGLDFQFFRWAWYAVNSRSVYYQTTCSHLDSVESNMALAPFLDLLNHSIDAKCEARYNPVNNCYEIITWNKYKKYEQVFISYGAHDNHKLFLEYGFILPDNTNSVYNIEPDQILDLSHVHQIPHLNQKWEILQDNDLLKDLSLSMEGLNWNLDTVFKILSCNWTQLQNWKQVMLGTISSREVDKQARSLAKILLNEELNKTLQQLQNRKPASNYHEKICEHLLKEDWTILQTSINLLS